MKKRIKIKVFDVKKGAYTDERTTKVNSNGEIFISGEKMPSEDYRIIFTTSWSNEERPGAEVKEIAEVDSIC